MSLGEMPQASQALAVGPGVDSDRDKDETLPTPVGAEASPRPETFDSIYQAYASFVWRNACRLGVPRNAAEDVMQDVFLVVYRRLPEFEKRTSVRAWLSAILIRVVRARRRWVRRKGGQPGDMAPAFEPDRVIDPRPTPLESAERDEAVRELYTALSAMNEERREVFVLSELEELTAPEIAQALGVNLNTVYWRLRTARREFEQVLFRRRRAEARTFR